MTWDLQICFSGRPKVFRSFSFGDARSQPAFPKKDSAHRSNGEPNLETSINPSRQKGGGEVSTDQHTTERAQKHRAWLDAAVRVTVLLEHVILILQHFK